MLKVIDCVADEEELSIGTTDALAFSLDVTEMLSVWDTLKLLLELGD